MVTISVQHYAHWAHMPACYAMNIHADDGLLATGHSNRPREYAANVFILENGCVIRAVHSRLF